jgi:ketosteroid isomerase-like protein
MRRRPGLAILLSVTPEDDVEVVRGAVAAWNDGDMDRLRGYYDPDIVMRPLADWPEAPSAPVVGRDELMRVFFQIREPWDATDVLEVLGDPVTAGDRVVVRYLWKAEGHGPPMKMEMTYVNTVRGGLIREIEIFWDHDEALEAIGLKR